MKMGDPNAYNTGSKKNLQQIWIVFIDSDDYYDHRAIEYLVELRDRVESLVATPVIEVRNEIAISRRFSERNILEN